MLDRRATGALAVSIGQHSIAGRKETNQDFHGALIPEGPALALKGVALAIADGISSSSVSHVAAETAVKSFLTDYYCASDAWSAKTAGYRVIAATNAWLHAETRRNRLAEDMNRGFVCTFSAMVLKGRSAHLFHAGDSAIHRVAAGALERLTASHRTVISSRESYLARALGLAPNLELDYRAAPLRPGEIFVMTTDGVHEHVGGRAIVRAIEAAPDLDAAARAIVEQALANGSADNLTVQIVRIDSLPDVDAASAIGEAGALAPAPPPRPGTEFEGYRIVRPLHASARSHVFLAVDVQTGDRVALKFAAVDMRDDADHLRRLAMEEWVARRLQSAHVLTAAPARRERESLFVAHEYVEGRSLRQWMHDHPEPGLEQARVLVEQIAKGLTAFHRKDMLHQDLRPENIVIDADGTAKIIDFGSVRVAGVVEAHPDFGGDDILGTQQYAAPEYFIDATPDERADLYSLGVIAYELLTGRLPYGARMARATGKRKQARVAYTPITAVRRDLPSWIDDALRKAVHHDPDRRQQVVTELVHDLRHPPASPRATARVPLVERNPLLFWKLLSLALAIAVIWLVATR